MKTEDDVKLEIEQEEIHKVNKFKYLGSFLEVDGRSSAKIEKRISTERKIIGMLNSVLWGNNIVHNTKGIIYNSLVLKCNVIWS